MRILFEIKHPARAFMYKAVSEVLTERGHKAIFVHSGRETARRILERSGLRFHSIPPTVGGLAGKLVRSLTNALRILEIAKSEGVDVLVDGVSSALAARLLEKPHIFFFDSEFSKLIYATVAPLTTVLVHPSSYGGPIHPRKSVFVNASKEVAYLHPKRFKPDKGVLRYVGKRDYVIIWKNPFAASHDLSQRGFSTSFLRSVTERLGDMGYGVFFGSEGNMSLPPRARPLPFPPEDIHSALYFAEMVITDATTIAVEAAMLGTPVIRYNTFVLSGDLGVVRELEGEGLLYNARSEEEAMMKVLETAANPVKRREEARRYVSGKEDLAVFLADLIEEVSG